MCFWKHRHRQKYVWVSSYIYVSIYLCVYIYIYVLTPPPPNDPAFCKQWIMGGGQPPMRKHRQAPISQKFVKLEVRKHRQAPISPKFPKSQQLRPRSPHRCQDFRNFGEIRAWRCLALPASNFGEIRVAMFWKLRMRKHRQAPISPKFVKLEVRKHRQAPISPKFPKSQQLRPRSPLRCQDSRNFGEIRAWRCFFG